MKRILSILIVIVLVLSCICVYADHEDYLELYTPNEVEEELTTEIDSLTEEGSSEEESELFYEITIPESISVGEIFEIKCRSYNAEGYEIKVKANSNWILLQKGMDEEFGLKFNLICEGNVVDSDSFLTSFQGYTEDTTEIKEVVANLTEEREAYFIGTYKTSIVFTTEVTRLED